MSFLLLVSGISKSVQMKKLGGNSINYVIFPIESKHPKRKFSIIMKDNNIDKTLKRLRKLKDKLFAPNVYYFNETQDLNHSFDFEHFFHKYFLDHAPRLTDHNVFQQLDSIYKTL